MKNYNHFLLENVFLSNSTIIEIIKSLQKSNDKELLQKIINNKDKNGKTLLMNIVESKSEESLIDFILQFDIDINHIDKNGNNVLFYAKNMKTFKKLYDLGADPTIINKKGLNTLLYLVSKNMFNRKIFKRLIDDGVDINLRLNKSDILTYVLPKFNRLKFLFDNGFILSEKYEIVESYINKLSDFTKRDDVNDYLKCIDFLYNESQTFNIERIFNSLFYSDMKKEFLKTLKNNKNFNIIDFSRIVTLSYKEIEMVLDIFPGDVKLFDFFKRYDPELRKFSTYEDYKRDKMLKKFNI